MSRPDELFGTATPVVDDPDGGDFPNMALASPSSPVHGEGTEDSFTMAATPRSFSQNDTLRALEEKSHAERAARKNTHNPHLLLVN